MPGWGEALVALVCALGVIGTVLPVLPGSILIAGAVVVWAAVEGSLTSWVTAAGCLAVLLLGHGLTVLIPGRRMTASGIPLRTLIAGGLLGIAGLFVVPLVGLPLGFVLGVYLAELVRLRTQAAAWASTVEAMKGTGLSLLIGLAAAVLATALWATVAVTT
jgi:uncharacterized protein YqgC (DUF456 family)